MNIRSGCLSTALVIVLLPVTIVSIYLPAVVWNIDPERDLEEPQAIPAPDTVSVTDTLYSINGDFQRILQQCYFLDVCRQRQIVSFEQQAIGRGIVDRMADVFTDVTLDMYLSVPVVVYAGIDASQIEVLDCVFDEELNQISMMKIFVPRAEITYSMVDLSENPLTHYREGHVRGTMYLITEFLVDACAAAEPRAREMAVASGILQEADRACEQEIRVILGSVGVRSVELVRERLHEDYSMSSTSLTGGI